MTPSTVKDIQTYFETLAAQHNSVNGFVLGSVTKFMQGLNGNEIEFPCVALEDFTWSLQGVTLDSPTRKLVVAFHVIDINQEPDHDLHRLAEQSCDPIAIDFLARMYEDYNEFTGDDKHPIKGIDFDSVQGQFLGRNFYGQHQFGVRYEIEIQFHAEVNFNQSNWTIPDGYKY